MYFHPYRIWNDTHSTNGIPFYILGKLLGDFFFFFFKVVLFLAVCIGFFFFLEVVLFLAVYTGMRHCFFIWLAFLQLKHLALAAFCTLKFSSATNFALWDIDPLSLQAFKYSIRELVSRIGLSMDQYSSLAFSKASCFKIIFCKVSSLIDFLMASFNFPINWEYSLSYPWVILTNETSELTLSTFAHALQEIYLKKYNV